MSFKAVVLALSLASALVSGAQAAGITAGPGGLQVQINPDLWKRVGGVPMAVRGKGCTFYESAGGGGESWHKDVAWLAQSYPNQDSYAQYVTTVGDWWNDKISSIQCDDSEQVHCSVSVFHDTNSQGGDAIFWGSQGLFDLANFGWNDTISSFMVFCNLMK